MNHKHRKELSNKASIGSKRDKASEDKPKQSVEERPRKIMVFDKATNRYVDKN